MLDNKLSEMSSIMAKQLLNNKMEVEIRSMAENLVKETIHTNILTGIEKGRKKEQEEVTALHEDVLRLGNDYTTALSKIDELKNKIEAITDSIQSEKVCDFYYLLPSTLKLRSTAD